MAVVWFHFCRFHHFTKLNAWHCGAASAVWCKANSKRIWLHLKCTMAFIHSTIWNMLSTNWDKHVYCTRVHTEREKKNDARSIHIKCIELALHFYCLFVCLLVYLDFFIHSFCILSSFAFCSFLVHSPLSLPHLRVVSEVFFLLLFIQTTHVADLASSLNPFIGWIFGLFFCLLLFVFHFRSSYSRPPHCVALLIAFFSSSSFSWSYLWNAHEVLTKTIWTFKWNTIKTPAWQWYVKNNKKKYRWPLCVQGEKGCICR